MVSWIIGSPKLSDRGTTTAVRMWRLTVGTPEFLMDLPLPSAKCANRSQKGKTLPVWIWGNLVEVCPGYGIIRALKNRL
jgi:hypothetical protein